MQVASSVNGLGLPAGTPRTGSRTRLRRAKEFIATSLCLLPVAYLLGAVGYAIVHWSEFATAVPQLLRYVIVPGLIAAALIAVAVRGSRWQRVNIGGTACSLLLALFICEALLEVRYARSFAALLNMSEQRPAESNNLPPGLPPSWTVRRLNSELGTTTLSQAMMGHLPYASVHLCTSAGQAVTYRADRYGFRNPDGAYRPPVDVLLVGDSFVEGICLPPGMDLGARVREESGSALSLGMRGAGPLLEVAMLGRYGPVVRPRWSVIVFYEGNDWDNLDSELRIPWLRQALEPKPDFGTPQVPAATAAKAERLLANPEPIAASSTKQILVRSRILRNFFALHQTGTKLGLGYPPAPADIPQFADVLSKAQAITGAWKGKLAIVYIPQTSRYSGWLPTGAVYDQVRGRVRRLADSHGVPFIDMTDLYAGEKDPLSLYGEGHLSAKGAALTADAVTASIRRLEQERPAP